MNQFINISDERLLNNLLLKLDNRALPLWGKMKPQQMIEHLVDSVEYTNGKKIIVCTRPAEVAARDKAAWVYTDIEMTRNVILGPLPLNYKYASLDIAMEQLMKELYDFEQYFKMPGATSMHFAFGEMDYNEWRTWHGKHFTHHFKQFSLIPE